MWSEFDELGTGLLNLFAPRGRVFWSLGIFRALADAEYEYVWTLERKRSASRVVEQALVNHGIEPKSVRTYTSLGLLARAFGDRFFPTVPVDLWYHQGRHFSLAFPMASKAALREHFIRQLAALELDAVQSVEDTVSLVADQSIHQDALWPLLGQHPVRMGSQALRDVRARIEKEQWIVSEARPGTDIHVWYAHPGAITLGLPTRPDAQVIDAVGEICAFRAELAVRICPLPVLERLRADLDTPGWQFLSDGDRLRRCFDARLNCHAFIADAVIG